MKHANSRFLAAGLGLAFLAGLTGAQAADKENDKNKQKNPPAKPAIPGTPPRGQTSPPGRPGSPTSPSPNTQPVERQRPKPPVDYGPKPSIDQGAKPSIDRGVKPPIDQGAKPSIDQGAKPSIDRGLKPSVAQGGKPSIERTPVKPPPPPLSTKPTANGGYEKTAPSGVVREKAVTRPGGERQVQQISPTGRVEKEVVRKPDGTVRATSYDLGNREKRVEVAHADGSKATTDVHYDRKGEVRARETVKLDAKGAPVSKTVEVKNNLVIHNTVVNKNTTIINRNVTVVNRTTVVREYRPCRYGYVYAPVVIAPVVYAGWYDPYWYGPPMVVGGPVIAVRTHSFAFSWGWSADPWYAYHRTYWQPYPVYAAPSYWVTDWMVAGYLADRYAVAVSVEQTREEVRLAREEAAQARAAAEKARDEAEIAEARATAAAAELRATKAEERAHKAEVAEARRKELGDQPNPKATPIDASTKDALNSQIEKTIAEKKGFADQAAKGGNPIPPDVSLALADPEHIYPVSKTISVISAKDSNPAGNLTPGDLLKVEPGQEAALKNSKETDFVTMRVMTSKGEDDEVPAGTLIKISMKDLQDFDNEFRAKLDKGLELASENMDQFKKGAAQQ